MVKITGLAAALAAAALIASCSSVPGKGTSSVPAMTPADPMPAAPSQSPAAEKEMAARYTAPFTGMPIEEQASDRPMLVMVNNHPSARPQSGLGAADVLYESLAEGEVTRIAALYQSAKTDVAVGPVRSIRPYYIDLGKIYDAVLIHAGGSPDAYTQLDRQKLDHLDEITNAGQFFWRESFRKSPHNLYTGLAKLRSGTDKLGLRGEYTPVSAMPAFLPDRTDISGEPAPRVQVTFLLKSYVVSYAYDEALKQYTRYVNDEPHIDLGGSEPLTASNVVVLGAEHVVLDNEGRRDIKLTGSGPGYLFQRNKAQPVEWRRKAVTDSFHLYRDGQEIGLYPGKTHYLIVPDKPSFEEHLTIRKEPH
ncbi:DUF3048 domain-containing protein [Paenibacillus piri]|nr:DUF3048 domain-containing protein [Paenibacillus piri]